MAAPHAHVIRRAVPHTRVWGQARGDSVGDRVGAGVTSRAPIKLLSQIH